MSVNGVLVCGEITREGDIDSITLELLSIGRRLAESSGEKLIVALFGDGIGKAAEEVAYYGADMVYKVESPLLEGLNVDIWVEAVDGLYREIQPKILLMGQTATGMDIAPRLAFKLNTPLTTDCTDLNVDAEDGLLLRTKPVYGGNVSGVFKYQEEPQFVTVRTKAFEPVERGSAKCEIIPFNPDIDRSMIKVESIERVKEEVVELDKAEVIVAAGRGIEEPENLEKLQELLDLLKRYFDSGEIGCSRPLVDQGWLSSPHQVGLTGQKVAPQLYIAIGISGASQHVAGISGAKKVVAINKSSEAPIFKIADYGVVGEYEETLPAFKQKLEEIL
ncbi:MAG: electron transfer flavoprotein subunit alpha/FixB family protein [Actinomycetota bacterium]|nr:electron transfer flavoprotein subunit alpha/FixB family protein [Actinomycetota bacterium]